MSPSEITAIEPRSRPKEPRLAPLSDDEVTPEQAELLRNAPMAARAPNFFRSLARSPSSYRGLVAGYGAHDNLPQRDYELLALRTAWRCRCAYVFAQHRKKATTLGVLSPVEVDRLAVDSSRDGWRKWEANLLRVVDELHDDACISESTWVALRSRYDDAQLVDIPLVVGSYHVLSFAMNSYGVQLEPGGIAFATSA